MLSVYFLALSLTILDVTPKAAAQNFDYETYIHLSLFSENKNPRLTVITTADGKTNIFNPYPDSQYIQEAIVTIDFYDYGESTANVDHLTNRAVLPFFAVGDRNTSGLANDYVMGVDDEGETKIVAVLSDSDTTIDYCAGGCIDMILSGYTSTSYDFNRTRWVSLVVESIDRDCFATSPNLKDWTYQCWEIANPAIGPYENILEMFPIADLDFPDHTVWVLIRNEVSFTDSLPHLMWDTFVPDDYGREYQPMGVLDGSPYVVEYALVNDDSTDLSRRKVVVVQRADYSEYGIDYNTFITAREVTYKDGRLRQMPLDTVYGPPVTQNTFPTITYEMEDQPVLASLAGSVVFKIEAELEIVDDDFGFYLFLNPDDDDFCAVSLTISGQSRSIALRRLEWFAPPGPRPRDNYIDVINFYFSPPSGTVQVLILVDYCIIEYFVMRGIYVGSIVAFPDLSWDHHEFFSEARMTITNLTFTTYDPEDD